MTRALSSALTRALSCVAYLLLVTFWLGCPGGENGGSDEVTVFAAASLADVLEEQAEAVEADPAAPRVSFHFAGSNLLAQQILAGAPADLFVSADRRQAQVLADAGRVDPGRVTPILANRLVVVVPAADARTLTSPRDLLAFRRLALADPEAVPAGVYARDWLRAEGLWEDLADRVVPALDVRAALAAVAGGHLPAAVVYATDAASSDAVAVAYEVPAGAGPDVRYYAAPILGRDGDSLSEGADALLRHLASPAAAETFRRHGFQPVEDEAPESNGTDRGVAGSGARSGAPPDSQPEPPPGTPPGR